MSIGQEIKGALTEFIRSPEFTGLVHEVLQRENIRSSYPLAVGEWIEISCLSPMRLWVLEDLAYMTLCHDGYGYSPWWISMYAADGMPLAHYGEHNEANALVAIVRLAREWTAEKMRQEAALKALAQ